MGADRADFLKDTRAPSFPKPWKAVSTGNPAANAPRGTRYFAIHSWYAFPSLLCLLDLMSLSVGVQRQLDHLSNGQCIGYSTAITMRSCPVLETVSVWRSQKVRST